MEGNRRDLEGEPHDDQTQADQRHRTGGIEGSTNGIEGRGPDGAVEERHAVEHHRTRKGADHEVFEGRFVASQLPAVETREHIDGKAHEFEAQEHGQEVDRRHHQHHSRRRQQNQGVELPVVDSELGEIGDGQGAGQEGRQSDRRRDQSGKRVQPEHRMIRVEHAGLAGSEGRPGRVEREGEEGRRHEGEGTSDPDLGNLPTQNRLGAGEEHLPHQHDHRADAGEADRGKHRQIQIGHRYHRRSSATAGKSSGNLGIARAASPAARALST